MALKHDIHIIIGINLAVVATGRLAFICPAKHSATLDKLSEYSLAIGSLGIERQRLFAGVELKEIIARLAGVELQFCARGVANAGL